MDEKILTQRPQGKQGVHLSKAKYDPVRKTILQIVREYAGSVSLNC